MVSNINSGVKISPPFEGHERDNACDINCDTLLDKFLIYCFLSI